MKTREISAYRCSFPVCPVSFAADGTIFKTISLARISQAFERMFPLFRFTFITFNYLLFFFTFCYIYCFIILFCISLFIIIIIYYYYFIILIFDNCLHLTLLCL